MCAQTIALRNLALKKDTERERERSGRDSREEKGKIRDEQGFVSNKICVGFERDMERERDRSEADKGVSKQMCFALERDVEREGDR